MTAEEYLNEHDRYEGEDKPINPDACPPCCCAYCGDELMTGEVIYELGEEKVHDECFLEYAEDAFTPGYLALCLGYTKKVVG